MLLLDPAVGAWSSMWTFSTSQMRRSLDLSVSNPVPISQLLSLLITLVFLTQYMLVYHIHDQPVPADGNCSGTLAHLDPFKRGEKPPCDKSRPDTCQVGDLGGKYGDIMDVANGKHFKATYLDFYTSTRHGPGAFFGNRSIVVHYHNTTRINCANFTLVSNQTTPYPTGGQPRPTQTPPPLEAAASRVGALSAGVIIASVAALMW